MTSFFTGVGVGAVLPFLTVFVTKITHCSDHQAEQMFLVLMVATAVGVLPFGWLCDRIGPRAVLMVGLGLIVIASINGLWVQTLPQVAGVLVLAGLGNAAQSASAYPLLTRLVPGAEVGFYTGLQSTALSIAAPATSVITGLLVDRGSYRWIFVVCGISVAIAISSCRWSTWQQRPARCASARALRPRFLPDNREIEEEIVMVKRGLSAVVGIGVFLALCFGGLFPFAIGATMIAALATQEWIAAYQHAQKVEAKAGDTPRLPAMARLFSMLFWPASELGCPLYVYSSFCHARFPF